MLASAFYLLLIAFGSGTAFDQVNRNESKHYHSPMPILELKDGEYNTKQHTQELPTDNTCSDLWFTPRNGTCHCGSTVYGAVTCNEQTKEVMVLDCYCMTTDSTNQTVVGKCFYNCVNLSHNGQYQDDIYHQAPSDCTYLHRRRTLCGECETDYYLPAYSYDIECIKCTHPDSWLKYFAFAFLPLTIFIAIIFVFRISVVSPKLHAFVSFAQILSSPINLRIFLLSTEFINPVLTAVVRIYAAAYGIWNLDFLRTLLPSVCLHLTTLEVLALDYLIAVYPMLLMVIAYILVELHGHGFRPVVLMWKPFHYFFVQFRRVWDIQNSIVDTFVTFFILSTTKLFSVSYNLLIPTLLYNVNGNIIGVYSYYNPNLEYMKGKHLPYALLALTVSGLFIALPLSLLVFSSFRCVRNCFGRCKVRTRIVEKFLHAFQQYYKDGTNGTIDCRWYAAYYILVNLGLYIFYSLTLSGILYILAIVFFIITALVVLLVEPYKQEYAFYNIVDCVQYLWLAVSCSSLMFLNFSGQFQRNYMFYTFIITAGVTIVPLFYILTLFICEIGKRSGLNLCNRSRPESEINQSLPDRLYNPNQYRDSCGYIPIWSPNLQIQNEA